MIPTPDELLFMESIKNYARDRVVLVMIYPRGRPLARETLRTASGFLLDRAGRLYFVTALHVWNDGFLKRSNSGEELIFKADDLVLRASREFHVDEARDLVFFPLAPSELGKFTNPLVTVMPPREPPIPDDGYPVLLSSGGLEESIVLTEPNRAGFVTFSMMGKVVLSDRHHVIVEYDQATGISVKEPLNPHGTSLSGLSGGPAFIPWREADPTLFGLISSSSTPMSESGSGGRYAGGGELIFIRPFADTNLLKL